MSKNLYLFDCFGVVISEVSSMFLNNHLNAQDQLRMRKIFRTLDLGKIDMDEMFVKLSNMCGMKVADAKAEWQSYEKVFDDTLKLIEKLRRAGHTVALLSNASVGYVDYLFAKFGLYKYFDKIFVSSNYGYAKPDIEFYKLCLNGFDEKFDKIYFTDDNPVNLKGLEQLGIIAVPFTSAREIAELYNADV